MSLHVESAVENVEVALPKSNLGFRHVQALLMFFALLLAFVMRANMSMAIVAMTDKEDPNSFHWSVQTQSVILSSFFWGYIILQIPAGAIAGRFGAKIVLAFAMGVNSAIIMVLPVCAYYGGWQLVCVCRVIQGLTQGFMPPSIHTLIAKWAPMEEKSRLGTLILGGAYLGNTVAFSYSGLFANYWGWPSIFYSVGILGALWTVLYVFFGAATPQDTSFISEKERLYIQTSLGHFEVEKKLRTPWKSIGCSVPFYALAIVQCGQNWCFFTLLTEIPSYMKNVVGVDIKSNGLLSALPYLSVFIMTFPCGFISDYAIAKKWASVTVIRKIANSIGTYCPALALIALAFSPDDVTIIVLILVLVVSLNASVLTGYLLVHIDMAPNFAGILMGITNTLGNVMSLLAPLAAGALLNDETDSREWRKVFLVSSAVFIVTNTIFVIFGSSEKQKWNDPDTSINEKDITN